MAIVSLATPTVPLFGLLNHDTFHRPSPARHTGSGIVVAVTTNICPSARTRSPANRRPSKSIVIAASSDIQQSGCPRPPGGPPDEQERGEHAAVSALRGHLLL